MLVEPWSFVTAIAATFAAVATLLLLERRCRRRTSSLVTERDEETAAETKATHEGPTLCTLGDDVLCVVFEGLRNPLEPRFAMDFSSANRGLWAVTQALRQQLRDEYEAAAALGLKAGLRSCKELREAKEVYWDNTGLSAADLALLGTLATSAQVAGHPRNLSRRSRPRRRAAAGGGAGRGRAARGDHTHHQPDAYW